MTNNHLTYILIVILLVTSCSQNTEVVNDHPENNTLPSLSSLPDLDSLNEKIIFSIRPLFPNVDTLVLDDYLPIYCGNATQEERDNDYFPIAANSSSYSKLSKILGKTILYKSKIYGFESKVHDSWDNYLSDVVQLSINGTVYSKNKIRISESYVHNFNYCNIEKWFTYSNGKWTYESKEKQCWTPK